MPSLYTFDVFDTLLTRRVGEPSSVFLALGTRLLDHGLIGSSAEAFARSRALAEPMAAASAGGGLASLESIHRQLASLLGLPEQMAPKLAELECQLERELVVPVPGARERLVEARRSGAEVTFISDMYLPTEFVRSLLEDHRMIEPTEVIHVSSAVGLSKRRGDLYPHVLAAHGRTAAETVHTGDDPLADVQRPRAKGIAARRFGGAQLNRYERRLEDHTWESQGLSSVLAGASRYARLTTPAANAHEAAIRDVTAGVAAPLVVAYVRWVLERARELGLDRLYFVARDGEVMMQVAEVLQRGRQRPLDLRYVYGSRQAWYPGGVEPDDPRGAVDRLATAFDDDLPTLLDRCGVDPREWLDPDVDEARRGLDEAVLHELTTDPAFLAAVRSGLRERQDRLAAYVESVGLLEGGPFGVVDLGWFGKSLHHLSRLLEARGRSAPVGFYLGYIGEHDVRQQREVWLTGMDRRLRFLMMETFCAGTHGQVTDFAVDETGPPRPVLRAEVNSPAIDWGLPVLRSTMLNFVEFFHDTHEFFPTAANARHAVMDSFEVFYNHPTRPEALAWGAFPFEVGASAERPERLAAGRDLASLLRDRFSTGGSSPRWPAGDHALAPPTWHLLVGAWRTLKRLSVPRRPDRHR